MDSRQLWSALTQEVKDFEDMLQYQCAVDSSCDCIVTINTKHFLPFCSIPLYKPDDMIALIDDNNLK